MKHREKVKISAREEVQVVSVSCDFCNKDIPLYSHNYKINKVTIEHDVGERYPESGAGTKTGVDMCSKCFTEKFIPWVRSQNIEPFVEEWDW